MEKQRSIVLFESSIKSEETRERYRYYLDKFKDNYKLKDYDSILKIDTKQLTTMLEDFVLFQRKVVGPNTVPTQMFAIQSFLEINDVTINWKRIKRLYPAKIKQTGLQAWSTDDIQKMLELAPDVRARALILFLASSGIRIGAIDEIKLKHINERSNECISVLVYPNSTEEYYTFLTPEAGRVLEKYFDKRKRDGEHFTPESPVFRQAYQIGIEKAKPLSKENAEFIIRRVVKNAGLRPPKQGRRYEIQLNHGFRKRFNTILKLNKQVNSNIAEKLMGHKKGLDGVYLTPTMEELFEEFQKAIPDLSISNELRLKAENKLLHKKQSESHSNKTEVLELKSLVTKLSNTIVEQGRELENVKSLVSGIKIFSEVSEEIIAPSPKVKPSTNKKGASSAW